MDTELINHRVWFMHANLRIYLCPKCFHIHQYYDPCFVMSFFFLTFIYLWETQRDRAQAEEGKREKETQNSKQPPGSEQAVSTEPDAGLEATNHEIMTWAEVDAQLTEPSRCPSKCLIKGPQSVTLYSTSSSLNLMSIQFSGQWKTRGLDFLTL